jgi:hypothetical protein
MKIVSNPQEFIKYCQQECFEQHFIVDKILNKIAYSIQYPYTIDYNSLKNDFNNPNYVGFNIFGTSFFNIVFKNKKV